MLCDTERSLLIDAVMRSHPSVRDSVTVACGDSRFATFLVPETELTSPPANDIDPSEIWRRVWNLTYADAGASAGGDVNLAGWISSYTGQPMSESDMREWVRDSAASVMATGARTYLEIGCGTGLLLLRIAPASDRYLGTDFSETAIRYTAGAIRARQLADRAALAVGSAENIAALVGSQRFECVIINSVAQYFPDEDYLTRTIRGAISVTEPGGFIFIGDVRHKGLADAFYASILNRPGLPVKTLETLVRIRAGEEQELLIEPGYFTKLRLLEPAITGVQMSLKRSAPDNELTRFRYDVLLQVKGPVAPEAPDDELDWCRRVGSVRRLQEILAKARKEFIVDGIPNSRIMPFASWPAPDEPDPPVRVEEIWAAAAAYGWQAHLDWSARDQAPDQRCAGRVRALFHRRAGRSGSGSLVVDSRPPVAEPVTSCPRYAALARTVALSARSWARERLPASLVPRMIRTLPMLPATEGGHTDRDALRAAAAISEAAGQR